MISPNVTPTVPFPPTSGNVTEITLRDIFAAQVLNGMISADPDSCIHSHDPVLSRHATLAKTAYQLADAMIAARGVRR
jgi:hypothetical protein